VIEKEEKIIDVMENIILLKNVWLKMRIDLLLKMRIGTKHSLNVEMNFKFFVF
jgi:hypothetical protein